RRGGIGSDDGGSPAQGGVLLVRERQSERAIDGRLGGWAARELGRSLGHRGWIYHEPQRGCGRLSRVYDPSPLPGSRWVRSGARLMASAVASTSGTTLG